MLPESRTIRSMARKQTKSTKGRTKPKALRTDLVQRFAPSDEEARDEGPRLIPLSQVRGEHPKVQHYLALADTALLGRPAETSGKKLPRRRSR